MFTHGCKKIISPPLSTGLQPDPPPGPPGQAGLAAGQLSGGAPVPAARSGGPGHPAGLGPRHPGPGLGGTQPYPLAAPHSGPLQRGGLVRTGPGPYPALLAGEPGVPNLRPGHLSEVRDHDGGRPGAPGHHPGGRAVPGAGKTAAALPRALLPSPWPCAGCRRSPPPPRG